MKPAPAPLRPAIRELVHVLAQRAVSDYVQEVSAPLPPVVRLRLTPEAIARLASRKILRTGAVPPPAPVSL